MECIKCKVPMKKAKMEGVLVDKCSTCGGIWLDAGELEMLMHHEEKSHNELLKEAKTELIEEKKRLLITEGLCPKCQGQALHTYMRAGVELDRCPSCGGLFFDYGELDKVMNAEQTGVRHFLHGLKKSFEKLKDKI